MTPRRRHERPAAGAAVCRRPGLARLALAAGVLAAGPLAAQADAGPAAPPARRPLWELGLGAGVLRLPHYRGADQQHDWLLPLPYFVYRGEVLKADRDGARAVLFDTDRLEFGLSASASAPTRSRDNRAREGMADLAPTVELGPSLTWTAARGPGWKLDLRLPLRAVGTVSRQARLPGWTSTPHLNLDLDDLGGWQLGALGGPVFGSRGLHAYYYDVPAAQATAGRPAYRAAGGYAGLSGTLALSRRDGARWIGAYARYDALDGAVVADSPLVRQTRQWSLGLAVSWVLWQSATQVAVDR